MLMLIFSAAAGLCSSFYLYLASYVIVGIGYGGYRLNAIILGTVYTNISYLNYFSSVNPVKFFIQALNRNRSLEQHQPT